MDQTSFWLEGTPGGLSGAVFTPPMQTLLSQPLLKGQVLGPAALLGLLITLDRRPKTNKLSHRWSHESGKPCCFCITPETRDLCFTSSSVTSNNRSITYNEQKEFYWNIYTQG